ncbi:YceI family protein [Citricoccus sp. SGAir0253]|uniref:YceI family protein n=1 Tax=Citricoccus sp. SGAir0253 TaxID=2567881 RepID=UPI0010CD053F|nr:YceI family protein [Citricoccus sp. SGAir0253]QCU76819.1 YceI family protein [Citricoccus sp. SGAir0253]
MTALTPGTWNLDPTHTDVDFTVRHAGISKVRGTFKAVEGTLVVGEDAQAHNVNVTIAAGSIDTGQPDRDAHITSADFFETETHPNITFVSTEVRPQGNDLQEFTLVGDLTIKGVTQRVELEAEFGGQTVDAFGMTRAGFEAKGEISRKEFGITWNAPLQAAAGGVLVSDAVKIQIDASFVLPSEEGAQA